MRRIAELAVLVAACTAFSGWTARAERDGSYLDDGASRQKSQAAPKHKASASKTPVTQKPATRTPTGDRQQPTPVHTPVSERAKSAMSPQQQQNVQQLQTDMTAIKQGSEVTPDQKKALNNSLAAMADGETKPDSAMVDDLATDLGSAMTDGNLSNKEKAQLSADMQKVLNSANIPMGEVESVIKDTQTILQASGVTTADVQKIVGDMKAISVEMQRRAAQATQTTPALGAARSAPSLTPGSVPPHRAALPAPSRLPR
jgi:hypothetical protein